MINQTKCHDLCRKIKGDLTAVGCIQDVNIHEVWEDHRVCRKYSKKDIR